MNKNEIEIWKSHPDIPGIEVSMLGRVRTLDRVVSCRNGMRSLKGRVLKPSNTKDGYLHVNIKVDGKLTTKTVHRLVAQTFIPNPDNLPEVNHKDCNSLNNKASNLEFCTHEYNMAYKEKYGISAKECVPKSPVFAINLATLEVYKFQSQKAAGKYLVINRISIINVIKGRQKTANGYWFVNANDNAIDIAKRKIREIGKTKLALAEVAIDEFTKQVNDGCKIIAE